jgi:hypothetical protein
MRPLKGPQEQDMSYFIARLAFAQAGVSGSGDRVLVHAQDEAGAIQVLDQIETHLKKESNSITDVDTESSDQQENLFAEPRVLPISLTTYQEMKRILPAYAQTGLQDIEESAKTPPNGRLRPLAQIVSKVLARDASLSVNADLLEQSLLEAAQSAECEGIFADGVFGIAGASRTERLAEFQFGPRILARFQPQSWQNDYAIDVDGAFEQDVTAKVLALSLPEIHRIRDGCETVEDLVVHHHQGPFCVSVVEAILAHFEAPALNTITQDMLDGARIWANVDPSKLRAEVVAPRRMTFRLGDSPYTIEELRASDWAVDCVIPVPASSTYSDSVLERAISEVITGSETALTGIQFEPAADSYGPDYVALHVTGRVTNPDAHFELDVEAATPRARELRLLLNALTTSDVFQMTMGNATRRYHILSADQSKLHRLSKPGVTLESLERLGLVGECAVEYSLAEDILHSMEAGPEAEGYFSLTELFTASYSDDNTWTLQLESGTVSLCFF